MSFWFFNIWIHPFINMFIFQNENLLFIVAIKQINIIVFNVAFCNRYCNCVISVFLFVYFIFLTHIQDVIYACSLDGGRVHQNGRPPHQVPPHRSQSSAGRLFNGNLGHCWPHGYIHTGVRTETVLHLWILRCPFLERSPGLSVQ